MSFTRFAFLMAFMGRALSPLMAQDAPQAFPFVRVTGTAEIRAAPDRAMFEASVRTQNASREKAAQQHPENVADFKRRLDFLIKDGLTIQSSSFRLQRETPYVPQATTPPTPMFVANTTFRLKTSNVVEINRVLSVLAQGGLAEITGLQFLIEDPKPQKAAARTAAAKDALEQAQTYAKAIGVQLGDIAEISDNDGSGATRTHYEADMPSPRALSVAQTSLEVIPPQEVTVTASVNMSWRLIPAPKP
jgi:uncharacterized protein